MKSREERVISGELRPAVATLSVSHAPFDDNEEEEVEIMMDKGWLAKRMRSNFAQRMM